MELNISGFSKNLCDYNGSDALDFRFEWSFDIGDSYHGSVDITSQNWGNFNHTIPSSSVTSDTIKVRFYAFGYASSYSDFNDYLYLDDKIDP